MKIVSLNIGRPRLVMRNGEPVSTAIFKEPVAGRVPLRTLNLDGDRQADLSVHGGPTKAVYVYPSEHYDYWRHELPEMKLPWGMFGENFTTEGMLEDKVCIGDRYRVGTAELIITQPRMPCYKLAIRFGRVDIVKRFLRSGRSGFYFAVEREGEIGAGDVIERIARDDGGLTIADVVMLYSTGASNQPLLERASAHPALPASWRDYFRKRLSEPSS